MTSLRLRLSALLIAGTAVLVVLARPISEGWDDSSPISVASIEAWYQQGGPTGLATLVLWLVTTALTGWIVVGSLLQIVASFSLRPGARWLADIASPALVRRLVRGSAGVATAVGLTFSAADAAHADDPPGVAVMEELGPGDEAAVIGRPDPVPPSTSGPSATTPSTSGPVTSTSTPTGSPSSSTTVAPEEPRATDASPEAPPAPDPRRVDEPYVVAEGDCFWSIAEQTLAERGDSMGDARLVAYWQRIIDHNRSTLVAPDNPDLLYPGQVLALPPPWTPGRGQDAGR